MVNMNSVLIKRIFDGVPLLDKATPDSSGYDLRSALSSNFVLKAGDRFLFRTGIAIDLSETNLSALILPRSGLGSRGITLSNGVGLIDRDYRGEIIVSLWNQSNCYYIVQPYERIAQMIFVPINNNVEFVLVNEFASTERGSGGFGSTGEV
jgi:dUTP pyrophosphatase